MTSYLRITRICQYCGNDFIAKTTTTKYCGDRCSKRAYKERKKLEAIKASNEEVKKQIELPLIEIQSKEFLSIAETMQLLNISRTTIWRMIKDQKIKPLKFGNRVIIKKTDLLNQYKS